MRAILFFILLSFNSFTQEIKLSNTLNNQLKNVTVGGRIQGILQNDSNGQSQDIYLRRLRVNLTYKFNNNNKIVYDVRNDRANFEDKGDRGFAIGDAYWQINIDKSWIKDIRLFRAKVDVSYSQTSSSKNTFNPNRAAISDHAADFIVSGRRAANIQANGNLGNLSYQLVVADGVSASNLDTVFGSSQVIDIEEQKLTYGAKIRYYFIGNARTNKVQDTFYGQTNKLSLGIGHFKNDRISINTDSSQAKFNLNRSLTNIDLSFSNKMFRFLGEFFSFQDDLINLNSSYIGSASGYYFHTEYITNKWAPYIGFEEFDRWDSESGYVQQIYTVGLNYYLNQKSERYGVAFKKFDYDKYLNKDNSDQAYAYIMLDY